MKIFRLTVKPLRPSPDAMYELRGVRRWVYRIRRNGEVIRSGITDDEDHGDRMLSAITQS